MILNCWRFAYGFGVVSTGAGRYHWLTGIYTDLNVFGHDATYNEGEQIVLKFRLISYAL